MMPEAAADVYMQAGLQMVGQQAYLESTQPRHHGKVCITQQLRVSTTRTRQRQKVAVPQHKLQHMTVLSTDHPSSGLQLLPGKTTQRFDAYNDMGAQALPAGEGFGVEHTHHTHATDMLTYAAPSPDRKF